MLMRFNQDPESYFISLRSGMRFVQLYFECLGGDLIYSDNDLSFDFRLLSFLYFALSQTLSLYLSDDGELTFFFPEKKVDFMIFSGYFLSNSKESINRM